MQPERKLSALATGADTQLGPLQKTFADLFLFGLTQREVQSSGRIG